MKGKIFVLSAPSGAGKTSLLQELFKKLPELKFSVSATTRKPRPGEVNGKDYLFCSTQEFDRMIAGDELAEWQQVHSNYYGTPKAPLEEALENGTAMVLDIDVFGKSKFDKVYPENVGILVLPPSLDDLEHRLLGRGTDTPAAMKERMQNAKKEIAYAQGQGRYEYIVVNDDFNIALHELTNIFITEIDRTEALSIKK